MIIYLKTSQILSDFSVYDIVVLIVTISKFERFYKSYENIIYVMMLLNFNLKNTTINLKVQSKI